MENAKFLLGHLVATPGALATLSQANQDPVELLFRHQHGDWVELSAAGQPDRCHNQEERKRRSGQER